MLRAADDTERRPVPRLLASPLLQQLGSQLRKCALGGTLATLLTAVLGCMPSDVLSPKQEQSAWRTGLIESMAALPPAQLATWRRYFVGVPDIGDHDHITADRERLGAAADAILKRRGLLERAGDGLHLIPQPLVRNGVIARVSTGSALVQGVFVDHTGQRLAFYGVQSQRHIVKVWSGRQWSSFAYKGDFVAGGFTPDGKFVFLLQSKQRPTLDLVVYQEVFRQTPTRLPADGDYLACTERTDGPLALMAGRRGQGYAPTIVHEDGSTQSAQLVRGFVPECAAVHGANNLLFADYEHENPRVVTYSVPQGQLIVTHEAPSLASSPSIATDELGSHVTLLQKGLLGGDDAYPLTWDPGQPQPRAGRFWRYGAIAAAGSGFAHFEPLANGGWIIVVANGVLEVQGPKVCELSGDTVDLNLVSRNGNLVATYWPWKRQLTVVRAGGCPASD